MKTPDMDQIKEILPELSADQVSDLLQVVIKLDLKFAQERLKREISTDVINMFQSYFDVKSFGTIEVALQSRYKSSDIIAVLDEMVRNGDLIFDQNIYSLPERDQKWSRFEQEVQDAEAFDDLRIIQITEISKEITERVDMLNEELENIFPE